NHSNFVPLKPNLSVQSQERARWPPEATAAPFDEAGYRPHSSHCQTLLSQDSRKSHKTLILNNTSRHITVIREKSQRQRAGTQPFHPKTRASPQHFHAVKLKASSVGSPCVGK
ncbi:hypothetical protein, partial [Rhizobium setariae]|uniref:hypothetical protein n=1 Tax=Rhizobium setariae TaxID=2801340 RepID=UPI001AEDAACC